MSEALDLILKTSVQLEGVDCGGIYLVDSRTGEFDLSSSQGISAHFLSKFSNHKGPTSIEEPLYLSSAEIQSSQEVDDQYKDLTAVALIPVKSDNESSAVLSLGSHSKNEFSESDRNILEAIAIQIAAYMARVRAEQKMNERVSELGSVFNSFKYMFIVTDADLKIQSINDVVSEYFELDELDIIGKSIDYIYDVDNEEKDTLQKILESGIVIHLENQLKNIDERAVRVETRVAPGKRNNEDVLYFLSKPTSNQK